jgi:hypothetical protein
MSRDFAYSQTGARPEKQSLIDGTCPQFSEGSSFKLFVACQRELCCIERVFMQYGGFVSSVQETLN